MADITPVPDAIQGLTTGTPEEMTGCAQERLQSVLSPWLVLALFALIMFLNSHIGAWAQHENQLWGLMLTEWGLILLPVLGALWMTRADFRETLGLRKFSPMQGIGAAVMALSMFVLIAGFCTLQEQFLPSPKAQGANEAFKNLFQAGHSLTGLLALLFVMALSPAVCEEVLFRGALLTGLRNCTRPAFAIIAVAVLFGAFHGSIYSFAPTALLGLADTLVVWRTKVLWLGTIMHFVNNGTSALLNTGHLPRIGVEWVISATFTMNGVYAGVLSLLIAFAGALLGMALIEAGARKSNKAAHPSAS